MQLKFAYEVRDPIHGLIRLTEREMALIDSAPFQRLRRIRQLTCADLVYPGALHTRFEHSLGTLHVAQRILARLDELEHSFDNQSWEIVRLAALLHDIGHGPFSHVSEYVLDRHYDKEKVGAAAMKEKIHEKITTDVIEKVPAISGQMTDTERQGVIGIIRGGTGRDYRRDIVSSSLDADKMDYLLRDAHYAGVRYGAFDLDKIVDACRILPDGDESELAIAEDGIFAVEQLILAKHHMTQQVYGHRVRAVTDAMIVRGLELAIRADDSLARAYRYDGTLHHLECYLALDDTKLASLILAGLHSGAKDIYERLRDRRLYKDLARITVDAGTVKDVRVFRKLSNLDAAQVERLEAEVASFLGREPWEIIVHKQSVKNPAYNAPGVVNPEAVFVEARLGPPRDLTTFPSLVMGKSGAADTLHVIGP